MSTTRFAQPPVTGHQPQPTLSFFGIFVFASLMIWPRVAILGFWIFSDLLGRAYDGWVVPTLGFLVLPWTTMTYAIMWSISSDRVSGAEWAVVAFAVLLDLLSYGSIRGLRR